MSIRVVTHCYAETLPQYASFLHYHLSSILLYPKRPHVSVSVCYTPSDTATWDVLDTFIEKYDLPINLCAMDKPQLFRRSIGRNFEALNSYEELVWFCDVDHVFGPGCFDTLWDIWQSFAEKPIMVWPREIQIHQTHEIGDRVWKEPSCGLAACDLSLFEPKRYTRAIGGVQIVNGKHCRQYGYLNGHKKFQAPRTDEVPFGDFRDDIVFRNQCRVHGKVISINLPALYRMRHSLVTYQ